MIRVCSIDDVPPGEGRTVWIDGRRIAVFRADDGWFALDGACPHLGGPLADGIVARRTVICPLHERRFDLSSGREIGGGYCVTTHRVEVRGNDVYLEADRTGPLGVGGIPVPAAEGGPYSDSSASAGALV